MDKQYRYGLFDEKKGGLVIKPGPLTYFLLSVKCSTLAASSMSMTFSKFIAGWTTVWIYPLPPASSYSLNSSQNASASMRFQARSIGSSLKVDL